MFVTGYLIYAKRERLEKGKDHFFIHYCNRSKRYRERKKTRKIMLVRERNAARKRKSRQNMSISKIEEIRKYDRERKRIMRCKTKNLETGISEKALPEGATVAENPVSYAKPKIDKEMKSTAKKCTANNHREPPFVHKDGIYETENIEEFVTENKIKRLNVEKPVLTDKYRMASRYLRKMTDLKKQRKKLQLEKVQKEVLEIFLNKREFAHYAYETERVVYRLFDNRERAKDESAYKKKIKSSEKEEIRMHSISKHNANVFPTARFGRYYYLRCPISRLHADWVNSHRLISKSTIYRHMDTNVKPMRKTPHLQCYCKECGNLESKGRALIKANVIGATNNARHALEMTWCHFKAHQFGYSKRDELKKEERQFPSKECVKRQCPNCGIRLLQKRIEIVNRNKVKFSTIVDWEQFEYVDKKLDSVTKRGTLSKLLSDYLAHLKVMSLHGFFDMWMGHQFNLLLDNILPGLVVFVNDFAQNILLRFQKEPASIHWVHKQVTLHPTVAYFMCPGCGMVVIKEEIFHITSSLDHTWKTVDHFMRLNIDHLKGKGVKFDRMHDFTDNAAGQYKSRFVWNHLSNSGIPWCRHHFHPNHGKGPSDRASGFFKTFVRDNVLSQNVTLKNIDVLGRFASDHLENQPSRKSSCLHETQRKVFLSKEISHTSKTYKNSLRPKEKKTDPQPIHAIRSTGTPGIVELRSFDCCCHACIRMTGPCKNSHADPWKKAVVE